MEGPVIPNLRRYDEVGVGKETPKTSKKRVHFDSNLLSSDRPDWRHARKKKKRGGKCEVLGPRLITPVRWVRES